ARGAGCLAGLGAGAPAPPAASTARGAPRAPAASSSQGVTIEGATYSHESVGRVLARLAAMPTLEGVRLTATERVVPGADGSDSSGTAPKQATKKKAKPIVTFTISANLRSEAG